MISLFIRIKHHCPWIWQLVEQVNGWLFGLFYSDLAIKAVRILDGYTNRDFRFSLVSREDISPLSRFLNGVSAEHLACFNPHKFNEETFKRMFANKSFLMMKITQRNMDDPIVGYFFLRCFFMGKAFHGLLVDKNFCNQGLGTTMWALSMEICHTMGIRMFATVSSYNTASLRSVSKATHVRLVEKLADNYQLIECTKKAHEQVFI